MGGFDPLSFSDAFYLAAGITPPPPTAGGLPQLTTYSYMTYAQARQQLAQRLYDSTKQFWSDAELGVYLLEALRWWQAMTSFWRQEFLFSPSTGVDWYDLATLPNTLRPQTVTDDEIYRAIQFHLLEPSVGMNPWTGVSAQFTADDVIQAVQRRRDQLLSLTGCQITRRVVPAIAGRTLLPDSVIDLRRVAYLPTVSGVSDAFNRANASPPGQPWIAQTGSTAGQILNSAWMASAAGGTSNALYDGGVVFPPTQFVQATLIFLHGGSGYAGLKLRADLTDAYTLLLDGVFQSAGTDSPNDMFIHIFRDNRTGPSAYLTSYLLLGGPRSGDIFRFEIDGNVLVAKRNGITFTTFVDTGNNPAGSGPPTPPPGLRIGLAAIPLNGLATDIIWDDFIGSGQLGRPSPMFPEDAWGEQSFERNYTQAEAGIPLTYLQSTQPPISFDVDRPPINAGTYELLTVEAGPSLGVTNPIIDFFTRANENPMATPWAAAGAVLPLQLLNNAAQPSAATAVKVGMALYDGGITWPANQVSEATIGTGIPFSGNLAVCARVDDTGSGYIGWVDFTNAANSFVGPGSTCELVLAVVQNGLYGGLLANPPFFLIGSISPCLAGDRLRIEVDGNLVQLFYNDVLKLSVADNLYTAGRPGMAIYQNQVFVADAISWASWRGYSTTSIMSMPDDWTSLVKWGALADLLGRESNAKDLLRAAYCEARYQSGLAMLEQAAALMQLRIGNVPLQLDAVRAADQYQPRWQARTVGKPDAAYTSGLNMLALSPPPDFGPYSLTASVVRNAPLPAVDADFLQVARDDIDAVLDYAQHLAAFKMGGAEFMATMPLLQNFIKQASNYTRKLLELGEYASVLLAISSREGQMNPRWQPQPVDDSTGGSGGGQG